jgi:hypothetical protein
MLNAYKLSKIAIIYGENRRILLLLSPFNSRHIGPLVYQSMGLIMNSADLRILCTALSFAVIASQPEKLRKKDAHLHIRGLAQLIEKFCRESEPKAFAVANNNRRKSRRRK